MVRTLILAAALMLGLAGCSQDGSTEPKGPMIAPVLDTPEAVDIHSHAKPLIARVTHVALDLVADFTARQMRGTATLDILAKPEAAEIILDSKGLEIANVTDEAGRPLPWTLGTADPILGAPLTVKIGSARKIRISYASAPGAAALQWLTPAQTAGKKLPYLFSQGEAILNRSWIPTQDSPGIRQTWEARIVTPPELRAVMSAEQLTPEGEPAKDGKKDAKAWRFRMDKPVAPYLIAIAVGDIVFQPLGPRTGVYTEPSMMKAAAAELGDVEKMVDAAEKLYGPYRWGRYDLLVLPPSFPFGGMENPRLTFATPTIIAGDRSLVSLVAHELAHSWSGNLVTNATWADFWLNEGFTSYFENRIMEAVYGKPQADMEADLAWSSMQASIREAGGLDAPDTRLHLDLKGRDPDAGMTQIAYDKGATFLRVIEAAVGREAWDTYLRGYFDRFAFKPQTSAGFIADLRANLIKGDKVLEDRIDIDHWVYQVGLPHNAVHVTSARFAAVDAAARGFANGGKVATVPWAGWTTQERQRFLDALPRTLEAAQLDDLDQSFGLSKIGNSEIRFSWLMLAVANRYEPALPSLDQFLTGQGRRKFVSPLFTALMAQKGWGEPIARRIYAKARPGYHPVTSGTVDKIVEAAG